MPRFVLRAILGFLQAARARGPGILAALAVVVIATGIPAFRHEAATVHDSVTWHEALYYTLGLFTLQGNRFGYPHTAFLRSLYFIAPLIATSAVLGALVHLLEERAPLLVRRFRRHVVIGGLGNLGTTLATEMEKYGHPFIGIERRDDAPEVSNLRASGAGVVIVGDMLSAEVLRRARCHHAARVFFTAPSDVTNLDAAFNVRRLVRHARTRNPPTIYAHVYDVALSDSLRHQLKKRVPGDAPIVPFNSYRFAAKSLVANLVRDRLVPAVRVVPGLMLARTRWPEGDSALREPTSAEELREDRRRLLAAFRLEREADGPKPDLYAIVGLGRFGRSVARELLDATPPSTRLLVIERSNQCLETSLETFTPQERERFETIVGDANGSASLEQLASHCPAAVIVCTDNDIANLRLALDLQRRNVKTVTRMFDIEASTELARGLDERGISPIGLSRLFRTAVPILTHERQLMACVNLDVRQTPEVDHLFYLARVSPTERARLGEACVALDALEAAEGVTNVPDDIGLVWHRRVAELSIADGQHDLEAEAAADA